MNGTAGAAPPIGVVVVTHAAEGFVAECLESLRASGYPALRVVVVDNASPDGTVEAVRAWARAALPGGLAERGPDGGAPEGWLTLVHAGANLGFAGGVNAGLRALLAEPGLDLFWVLNPDAAAEPAAPFALARRAGELGRFAVIGGRVLYAGTEARVQTDGGRLHRLAFTGVNVNMRARAEACRPPDAASLDYVSGAHMLASRDFVERAGLLDDSWFLYFEEIDWQLRRGDLPLGVAEDAVVRHRAGATIGSGSRGEGASPFAVYFQTLNLMRFVARWSPARLPFAYAMAWWKLWRTWGADGPRLAAFLRGLHGLPPPAAVRARLPEAVWARLARRRGAGRPPLP
jgi:hypothetical protein